MRDDSTSEPVLWEAWIYEDGGSQDPIEAPTARDAAYAMSELAVCVEHERKRLRDPEDLTASTFARVEGAVERLAFVCDDTAEPIHYVNAEGWLDAVRARVVFEPGAETCDWSVRVHEHTVQRALGEDESVDWDRVPHETDLTLYTTMASRRVLIDDVHSVAIVDDRTVLDRAWPAHRLWGPRMRRVALSRAHERALEMSVEYLTGSRAEIRDQLAARGWETLTIRHGVTPTKVGIEWDEVPHETDHAPHPRNGTLTLYTSDATRRASIDDVHTVAIVNDRAALDRAWPAHRLWGPRTRRLALRKARDLGLEVNVEYLTGLRAELADRLAVRGWTTTKA